MTREEEIRRFEEQAALNRRLNFAIDIGDRLLVPYNNEPEEVYRRFREAVMGEWFAPTFTPKPMMEAVPSVDRGGFVITRQQLDDINTVLREIRKAPATPAGLQAATRLESRTEEDSYEADLIATIRELDKTADVIRGKLADHRRKHKL